MVCCKNSLCLHPCWKNLDLEDDEQNLEMEAYLIHDQLEDLENWNDFLLVTFNMVLEI